MGGHTGGGGDDRAGTALAESALTLSTRDVLAEEFKNREGPLAIVFEAGLMAFERGEEQDALDAGILAVAVDDAVDDGADETLVVIPVHVGLPFGQPLVGFAGFVVKIEDGGVEGLFAGEVAEDDGLGDSGGGGDFLGGGAFKALAGEEIERGFEELAAAVGGGKTGGG